MNQEKVESLIVKVEWNRLSVRQRLPVLNRMWGSVPDWMHQHPGQVANTDELILVK